MKTKPVGNDKVVECTKLFGLTDTVEIGKNVYVVKRHFVGQRDFQQAVFSVVENEAKRGKTEKQAI